MGRSHLAACAVGLLSPGRVSETCLRCGPASSASFFGVPLLVHAEHALGDEKAAEDVDRRHCRRQEAKDLGEPAAFGGEGYAHGEQGSDNDHGGNGVGDGHKWSVQGRRHAPYHVIANEDRDHEYREAIDEGVDIASPAGESDVGAGQCGKRGHQYGAQSWRKGAAAPLSSLPGRGAEASLGARGGKRGGPVAPPRHPHHLVLPEVVGWEFAGPAWRLGWTILPSRATNVPLMSSSSQFTFKTFSCLSIMVSRKARRFLA